MAWIECNWLHGKWGVVKAFIPDHIASQYRRFISFQCCLDRMQSCTSSTNLTIDRHNTVGSFQSIVAWIECNWLHGKWGVVKAFIPDHIASQYRRFISFQCCLDRMQSCTSSTNLTICPFFGTYCTIGTNVTNQREVCMGVLDVYTVLGETTRNPTNTMVKPLDSDVKLQL